MFKEHFVLQEVEEAILYFCSLPNLMGASMVEAMEFSFAPFCNILASVKENEDKMSMYSM